MATTTNYGWTTPDDTALVKDGASAIRSLGTSVDTTTKNLNPSTTLGDIEYRSSTANTNTRLGIGSSGQVLTVAAGVPSWASGFANPLTTTGDTIYSSSGTTPARLGIGSTGNVLTVAGGVPTWAAPAGAAITSATNTVATSESTSSGSYTDLTTSGPAVTITTGTKALVIVSAKISTVNDNESLMSYAVSGASTVAASDDNALAFQRASSSGTFSMRTARASIATLTAGSNTFTAKYRAAGDTSTYSNRTIIVINLG
jgi:hypothetical protein